MTVPVEELPGVEIGELPDFDAELLCEFRRVDCPARAAWRLTLRCSACGDPDAALLCRLHRAVMVTILPELVSACCEAPPADVKWTPL
jgi:hypothetical protein